jgi:hypothetical protein
MNCFVGRFCSQISKCGRGRVEDGLPTVRGVERLDTLNNWYRGCRKVSSPADTSGVERLCVTTNVKGAERPRDVYCWS